MGMYLNPGNTAFAIALNGDYIDKTGIVALINQTIDTPRQLTCISRPRRFGKSYAAKTLCAYYDHTCDSHSLFDGLEISRDDSYEKHINKYHIIYLDMSNILEKVKPEKLVTFIKDSVETEICQYYSDVKKGSSFDQTLMNMVETTCRKIIMLIDEWDAPLRECPEVSSDYLRFLRMLFKSSNTTAKLFAAAYITGILPIKKDGSQSAISDFREYSMLAPGRFAKYTGFTENEVKTLYKRYDMDFETAKYWYDGYNFSQCASIYNPYSVMMAMENGVFDSYWKQTSAAENLLTYIGINIQNPLSSLQEKILKLIAGEQIEIDPSGFDNDFTTFRSDDDVLTLLVHLGYLAYNSNEKRVRIPNEEVRMEFDKLLRDRSHTKLTSLIMRSEQLLADTLAGNENAVAQAIKNVRQTNYAPQYYNNEQSLCYAVKFAYIICVDRYMKVEELPSGKGLADVVYLPKNNTALPALVIELKWDETADTAINQIKSNNYPAILSDYIGEIILVGIGYDMKTKQHSCMIEKIQKE
ncbi:MAG: AAA family ATPase [Oscillospiraceae bacterium]|nr:AAA family ATPase [Oscillospiraceae bacterium]